VLVVIPREPTYSCGDVGAKVTGTESVSPAARTAGSAGEVGPIVNAEFWLAMAVTFIGWLAVSTRPWVEVAPSKSVPKSSGPPEMPLATGAP
jgi:hypothetical protein